MATAGIYYIDTFNFADATAVYDDAALTIFAADGFYQMGGVTARQQISGVLKPAEDCPSCSQPSPDPVPAANNAFKITDKVTGTQDHVVLKNNFAVGQEVTTSINSNCWLIDSLAVNGTANTISGVCVPDPGIPALYYLLNLCPVSSGTGAPSAIFTSIPPTSNQFIYLNTNSNAYYSYSNAAPINTPSSGIPLVENGLALTADAACPAVPPQFTYWFAQECNNPNNTIVIQAPVGTTFNEGTTSVKINGSTTCYQINSQRLGSATTSDGVYAGTAYTGCTSGGNPCIVVSPPDNSFVARDITNSSNEYDVQLGSGQIDDETQISAASGCYKLVSRTTRSTTNTITSPCPGVGCSQSLFIASSSGGSITYTDCASGSFFNVPLSANEETSRCYLNNTLTLNNVTEDFQSPCPGGSAAPANTDPNSYFTAELCTGGGEIVVKTTGSVGIGNSIHTSNTGTTCYVITSNSTANSTNNTITQTFSGCTGDSTSCTPTVDCYAYSVEYHRPTDVCPTGGNTVVFGNAQNNFSAVTAIWQAQSSCGTSSYALPGTYAFTSNGNKISRYWNGSQFTGATTTCSSTPQNITATISDFNLTDLKGDSNGYTITGSGIGSTTSGPAPLSIPSGGNNPFNTDVVANPGFSITGKNVIYSQSSIISNQSITVTITGTVTQDVSVNYKVRTCGNQVIYSVDNATANLPNNTIIFFESNSGDMLCGEIFGTTSNTPSGRFIQIIIFDGCRDSRCGANATLR